MKTAAQGLNANNLGEMLHLSPDQDWKEFYSSILRLKEQLPQQTPATFYEYYNWENSIKALLNNL
jgi:hypothetical protein